MENTTKKNLEKSTAAQPSVKMMVEDVVGCKWSTYILDLLDQGVSRPGEMARQVDGLTTKVLNERLKKLHRYNIVTKTQFNEVPPRVEYQFTDFGRRFLGIIAEIRALERDMAEGQAGD